MVHKANQTVTWSWLYVITLSSFTQFMDVMQPLAYLD